MIDALFSLAWGDASLTEILWTAFGLLGSWISLGGLWRFSRVLYQLRQAGINGQRRRVALGFTMRAGIFSFLFVSASFLGVVAMDRPQINSGSGSAAIGALAALLMELLLLVIVLHDELTWGRVIGGRRVTDFGPRTPQETE